MQINKKLIINISIFLITLAVPVGFYIIKEFNLFKTDKTIVNIGSGTVNYNENHYESAVIKARDKVSQDIVDIINKYDKNQKISIATLGDLEAVNYGKIIESFLRSKSFINVTNDTTIAIDRGMVGERMYFDKDYNELNIYVYKNLINK